MAGSVPTLRAAAEAFLAVDQLRTPEEFISAYDRLLWGIVTATRDELAELVKVLWQEPYIRLPAPILVAVLRLWGHEPPDDATRLRAAVAQIACFCSTGEESTACAGLRRRLEALDGSVEG